MSSFLESQNFDFEFDYQVPFSQYLFIGDIGMLKQIIINVSHLYIKKFLFYNV
jgi:hypothetical protein